MQSKLQNYLKKSLMECYDTYVVGQESKELNI